MSEVGLNAKGKCVGEYTYHAKLTFEKVAEMRRRYASGESCTALGKMFGVSLSTAWRVCARKSWVSPVEQRLLAAKQSDIDKIAPLVAQGYGFARIGKIIGATGSSVLRVMKANGLHGRNPAVANGEKTECIHGHPLSGDNLFIRSDGNRGCRACRIARRQTKKQTKE